MGATHAAFLAGACGSSAACTDRGDWTEISATVGPGFGQVVSAIAIGCDMSGVEVIIDLASGATNGTLALAGTFEGIEFCHGHTVSCPVSYTYDLDVSRADCTNIDQWYCGGEANSQLDLVTGSDGTDGGV